MIRLVGGAKAHWTPSITETDHVCLSGVSGGVGAFPELPVLIGGALKEVGARR